MRILYIDIDALRPDHLGAYGYHRNTSPNIDAIAKESICFTNCYASDAPCLPSRTAMMSGRFGIHTGVINNLGTASELRLEGRNRDSKSELCYTSLPATLKKSGLHTAYIGSFGESHGSYDFYAGFKEIIDTEKDGKERADDINLEVMQWLDRKGANDNWFLSIEYTDTHSPCRVPEEFGNPFKNDALIPLYNQELIDEHRKLAGPHTLQDLNNYNNNVKPEYPRQLGEVKNMADMHALIDGYDCSVKYVDDAIGEIIAKCEQLGIWDELIVFITSDHGENFGELGIYADHATADQATSRIPLIVRWPGKTVGGEHDGLWYNIDLLPTLADMLEVEASPIWDGKSFAKVLKGLRTEEREELILSQHSNLCQRSVRFGKWLYIKTYHDGWHLFDEEMLFDLESDPYEQRNIAHENIHICHEGAWRLLRWHEMMMRSAPEGYASDPMWDVITHGGPGHHVKGKLPQYLERLETSGRKDKAEILRKKYQKELGRIKNMN